MSVLKLYVVFFAAVGWLALSPLRATELDAAEIAALQSAHQGEVVVLNGLWSRQRELPSVPIKISATAGPQLLLSDLPEYFPGGDGIAMREQVKPGVVRLYVYHVPDPTNGPRTISAVLENLGTHPLVFRFLRRAFPKPGRDYYRIGKNGLIEFFNSEPEPFTRSVPPGGRLVIDPEMNRAIVTANELVHGFYEFEINQPARITTFERDPAQSSLAVMDQLPLLLSDATNRTPSGAGRGLFLTADFNVANEPGTRLDTAEGPRRLIVTGGRHDRALHGHDSIRKIDSATDSGNYGALYHIRLKRSASDGRSLALLMTKPALGGQWCSAQSGAVQVSQGIWPGGTVAIPAEQVSYGNPGEMVLIQKFPPPRHGGTDTIEILYSPPGASCMPTPFILVAY